MLRYVYVSYLQKEVESQVAEKAAGEDRADAVSGNAVGSRCETSASLAAVGRRTAVAGDGQCGRVDAAGGAQHRLAVCGGRLAASPLRGRESGGAAAVKPDRGAADRRHGLQPS